MPSLADTRSLLVGLSLGALGGALLPLGAPRPARPPALPSSAPPEPPPAPRDCATREGALSEAWEALQAAERRLAAQKEDLKALIGPRPDFSEFSARFQPERVEDEVQAALGEGAELAWIDCSEAPCIAVLSLSAETWAQGTVEVGDAFQEAVGTGHPWEAFGVGAGAFMTVPLGEPVDDARLHQRLDLREEFIIQELSWASRSQP